MDYGPDWPPREVEPAEPPSVVREALRKARARIVFVLVFWAAAAAAIVVFQHPYQMHTPRETPPQQESGPMWHKTVPDPATTPRSP